MNIIKKNAFKVAIAVIVMVLFLIVIFHILFAFPRISFEASFRNIDSETDGVPDVVVYGTLYTEDGKVDISALCRKENKNHSFKEAFCIIKEKAYFVYSKPNELRRNWILASIDLKTLIFEKICVLADAKAPYQINRNSEYKDRNGYYADGQIVLSDFETVLVYNIGSDEVKSYGYGEYIFPQKCTYGETIDSETVALYLDGQKKTFSLNEMSSHSKNIEKIYALKNKQTWDGTPFLSRFFSQNSIQIIGENIYAVGACMNFSGESYAVILEYDREKEMWQYASKVFSDDIVHRSCYLIPRQ